jgi:hypothetical protein
MEANDDGPEVLPPAVPAVPANTGPHLRLSAFWPTNPVAWFAMAEGQFIIRGVADEAMRYYHVLPCLPESMINLVTDFVGGVLPANPYTQLKARLLAAHQLTDYQRVEQIFQLPPLGAQKPSELLAEMLRLCPRGQENSLFFTYLFLHRLPRELCVLLTDVDHNDRRLLSERADQLWAHYAKHSHSTMACIEGASSDEDSGAVAAIRRQGPGGKPFSGKSRPRKGGSALVGGAAPSNKQQQQRGQRQQPGEGWLCWYHHTFGDQANACRQPCAWTAEN